MREDGGEVGEGREHNEGAHESGECGRAANVDAAQDRAHDAAERNRIERVAFLVVHAAKKRGEWGRVVSSQSPKHPAGRQVASDDGDKGG